jgi:SHS2 domain-containing protein
MDLVTKGFREIPHTADWELEVWALDLPELLEQAARGMDAISGVRLMQAGREERLLEIRAEDPETLLVKFLAELLYLEEHDGVGFDIFNLNLRGYWLVASLGGAPILGRDKEIKAVTYHNLAIRKTERGLEVRIVFDV